MRCPNCKETNHEPGARFCIICGTPLVADDEPRSRNVNNGYQTEDVHPSGDRQRGVPAWYYEGLRENEDRDIAPVHNRLKWTKMGRWMLLLLMLVEYIFISIQEAPIHQPWGGVTIGFVNVPAFLMTLFLCADSYHDEKKGFWKTYYTWLHFIPAAVVPIVGYLILTNIQNLLTIVLEGLLVFLLLVADFGTLETIFSD